jgi:hypothetical protein
MDNLFKLINEKHYVGHYLPYNSVGENNSDFNEDDEPLFILRKSNPRDHFDGKHLFYTFDKSVNGSKEEFEKNYGNPLCEVTVQRSTFVVEENEDKICLKVFYCGKHRKAGEVFFRKSTKLNYITFNKKTNIFTVGKNTEYHKKRGKGKGSVVRRNSFPISLTTDAYHSFMNGLDDAKTYNLEITEGINLFLSKIGAEKIINYVSLPMSLFGCLLDKQGVKKPDNWRGYYNIYPKPTKKDYKKYGFKMVDAYMKLNDVSSEKIKKVLHKVQNPCFKSIKMLMDIFGRDFILQRPEEELCIIFNTKIDESPFQPVRHYFENFSKRDMSNCYQIYLISKTDHLASTHSFYDHVRFFDVLSRNEPIKWMSKTLKEFNAEHSTWSDKVDFYTTGRYSRQYSNEFVERVSKPIITSDKITFNPIVLQSSEEYVDESVHQSNCVRTYQNRPSSLIISLRKENGDRASIEYRPSIGKFGMNENQPVNFKRVQTLGRFNNMLDDTWDDAIFILDVRLKSITSGVWGNPVAEFVTGGGRKEYNFIFDKDGQLNWEHLTNSIDIGDDLPYIDFEW